jgi:hypothetical protein
MKKGSKGTYKIRGIFRIKTLEMGDVLLPSGSRAINKLPNTKLIINRLNTAFTSDQFSF